MKIMQIFYPLNLTLKSNGPEHGIMPSLGLSFINFKSFFSFHQVKSLFSEGKWTGAQYYAEPGLFLRRSPDTWHTFSQEHHYPWICVLLYSTYYLFFLYWHSFSQEHHYPLLATNKSTSTFVCTWTFPSAKLLTILST